ncbi:transposase family protein [Streptomyces sp. NPDC048281]|uniref:transposase family protein n=1 Tax=Streptomyces sp. NPDC048281 TaxID=3154715 RepID=UPI003445B4E1
MVTDPHLRAPGRPHPGRSRLSGRRLLDDHRHKGRSLQELTLTEKTLNRALSAARGSVERVVARLKDWRIFRRSRTSPNRMT